MTHRTITFTLLTLTVLALPALATAQGHHGRHGSGDHGAGGPGGFLGHGKGPGGFGPGMLLGRLADRLDLSDEQRTEIEAIYEASRDRTADLRDQLQTAREAFHEDHELGVFDETEARTFAATATGIQAELMVEHMRANAEAFNVLTPEQQDALRDLLEDMGDLFGPGRGGRECPNRG